MPRRPQNSSPNEFPASKIERPYDHPLFFLGTSTFNANGWAGNFYPVGMKQSQYLAHYAKSFRAVEIDSTFYGTPATVPRAAAPIVGRLTMMWESMREAVVANFPKASGLPKGQGSVSRSHR